jgi:hypothetical protein
MVRHLIPWKFAPSISIFALSGSYPVRTGCHGTNANDEAIHPFLYIPRLETSSKIWVFSATRKIGIVERVDHADAFDRPLRYPIEHLRGPDVARFKDRGHHVHDVMTLGTHTVLVCNSRRPDYDYRISCFAEVRGDLLGPLQRRVHLPPKPQPRPFLRLAANPSQ